MIAHIDIGVNLTNKSLANDLSGVFARASEANVETFIVTGTTLEESRQALALCESEPFALYCTAGIHPHHASDWESSTRQDIIDIARHVKVRALGEAGLDFNRNFSPEKEQIEAFEQQLQIACDLNKPIFLHQRDAHDTFVEILKSYRSKLGRVVVHCFTDTEDALRDYLDLDCYIGITGWICDERRGMDLQKSVKIIPDNRIMIETDAPYLLPRNLPFKTKSRINEPCYLPYIAQKIASCRQQELETLALHCLDNTKRFFEVN